MTMCDNILRYPDLDATRSVLRKIGVDPSLRIFDGDQDFEYTSCNVNELDDYFEVYMGSQISDQEKRVLGCFFLQCLNDYIGEHDVVHPKQMIIFEILHRDVEIHKFELEYWRDNVDSNEENWWYVTKYLKEWKSIS